MAAHPTVTVRVREVLQFAEKRARESGRTQQVELGVDLFVRISGQGRRFLLFQLEGEPGQDLAQAIADALGYRNPQFGWHQGATLRSLTVVEQEPDVPVQDD